MGAIVRNVELGPVSSEWERDDVGPYRSVVLELAVTWDCAPHEPLTERHMLGPFTVLGDAELDSTDPEVAEALAELDLGEVQGELSGLTLVRAWAEMWRREAATERACALLNA